jgi:hypothetical protein
VKEYFSLFFFNNKNINKKRNKGKQKIFLM